LPTTGVVLEQRRPLGPGIAALPRLDYNTPGEALIVSDALTKLYIPLAGNDAECRDVLTNWDGRLGFRLWPEAAADGIAIQPGNLPHVVEACGPPVTIGLSELRKLGIEPALLDTIDEAHRRGWYDKPAAKR
jgi:hypothetical protein